MALMENPGALAGATGADERGRSSNHSERYVSRSPNAMSLYAQGRHKRACRMIGYALTLGDPGTWADAGLVLAARLDRIELATLAAIALKHMAQEDRDLVVSAIEGGS